MSDEEYKVFTDVSDATSNPSPHVDHMPTPPGDRTPGDEGRIDNGIRRSNNHPLEESDRLVDERRDQPRYGAAERVAPPDGGDAAGGAAPAPVPDLTFCDRCYDCQFPCCTIVLFIVSLVLVIAAVIAVIVLVFVYFEIDLNSQNVTLASDQNSQNIVVMSNSTYKLDVNPWLFSAVRVRYNGSNNTESEYTPPSLALVRQSCTDVEHPQRFGGHYEDQYPFTTFRFARHWPVKTGKLNVTTLAGDVKVFYGDNETEYWNSYDNCNSEMVKCDTQSSNNCQHLNISVSGDVYIMLCTFGNNLTSFYYQLTEYQYNINVNGTMPILEPGDTVGIYVLFSSLVVEMFHRRMCTYLVTIDSDSDLQYTTPVIVEPLLPRWEEYALLGFCIFILLIIPVACFVVYLCYAYGCKKNVC